MKTLTGPESYGQFFIGNNRAAAYNLFRKLKGSPDADEKNMLYLDLMETKDGVPVNLNLIACTLEELVENCKLITKEVFKIKKLEEW